MRHNSLPTIDHIETTVFRLPMRGALQWGKSSRMAEARHVLIRVVLSSGAEGYAEAPPRPTIYGETATTICAVIAEELAPRVLGMAVVDPDMAADAHPILSKSILRIEQRLGEVKNNNTAHGALDMAIHDAVARHREIDLAQYLGVSRERVRVSYILGIGDRDSVLEEAERVTEQGVRVLKVKVGRDWKDDIQRITELKSALGPDVELYADANETMEASNASQRLSELAQMGLLYCEEPLPIEQIGARTRLRSGEYLPVIADDSAFSLSDLYRELEADTFDILNIKNARTGYTESLQMLFLVAERGKGCMVGSQASAGLGTARAAIFAGLAAVDHPSELSFPLKLEADILEHTLPIEEGYIRTQDAALATVDAALLRSATVSA